RDDRFTSRQGDVDHRLAALHGLFDGVQGAHLGALIGGDGEDGAVVFGGRNLHARVHAVLRDAEVTAGRVEVLQRNEGANVRVDAVSHFGCPLSSTMSDAILAAGSILLRGPRRKWRAKEALDRPAPGL